MGIPKKKSEPAEITSLLRSFQEGDRDALNALMPLVYDRLKRMATYQVRAQGAGFTLSATGLVHEVFVKLTESGELTAKDRAHFFAIAAHTMRWLLVDYARAKKREKRGGPDLHRVTFEEKIHAGQADDGVEASRLCEALEKLEKQDPRLCRVVELRHLVGLTIEEVALILGVSTMTVKRDWHTAKAWLARELAE